MLSNLIALRDIISSSVDTIVRVYSDEGAEFRSLDEPCSHLKLPAADELQKNPEVVEAIMRIVAGSAQLTATVQDPRQSLMHYTKAFYFSAALGVAEAGNIAEILREAGSTGMHIKELARRSGMHAKKLSIVMLYLATRHVFREVAPDIFANNSISSVLDSGKAADGCLNAESKLESSQGMSAEVGFNTCESMKSASYLAEALTDTKMKYSEELNGGAFQLGMNTDLGLFDYLDEPENAVRRKMFAKIMAGAVVTQPASSVLKAFDWGLLKPGSLVCDIGGGLGHVSMEIARAHPELQIVLEDTPHNAKDAVRFWRKRLPEAVDRNRVFFHGGSFFDPQPKFYKAPDVFLMRYVLHDWSDKYAVKILRNLRDAATVDTKLVVIDTIVAHTCKTSSVDDNPFENIPPKPLLRNWGEANLTVFNVDISVLTILNGGERTREGFEEIFEASGWKIDEIRWQSSDPNLRPSIIAHPL